MTAIDETLLPMLEQMKNSSIQNYVVAGLKSSLIGGGAFGCVRMFEGERYQQDFISPHSHRFDFVCLVLRGCIINRKWIDATEGSGDFFEQSRLIYSGTVGEHEKCREGRDYWRPVDHEYTVGDFYSMKADEIHSIIFGRGSAVLFFEGPNIRDWSVVLEPVVDGSAIPTYEKRDYMFKRISGESL